MWVGGVSRGRLLDGTMDSGFRRDEGVANGGLG